MVILGLFLGGYIGKKFAKRFRTFGIMAMVAAMAATGFVFAAIGLIVAIVGFRFTKEAVEAA